MEKRPPIPANVARQIKIEAGHRCCVCGRTSALEIAHIVPWSRTKSHKPSNLMLLCAGCHTVSESKKWGQKTLREYKKNPWVFRQEKTPAREMVTITIDIDIAKFGPAARQMLIFGLAKFLEIEPVEIRIIAEEEGSLNLTLELPVSAARKLIDADEVEDSELLTVYASLTSSYRWPEDLEKILSTLIQMVQFKLPQRERERDIAEDLVQDSMIRLINWLREEDGPHEFNRAFLLKRARWIVDDWLKRKRLRVTSIETQSEGDVSTDPNDYIQVFEAAEAQAYLNVLEPERYRNAVRMSMLGHSHKEIADALSLKTAKAAENLIHRGRRKMRQYLEKGGWSQ